MQENYESCRNELKFLPGIGATPLTLPDIVSLVVTTQIMCIFPPKKIEPPATIYNHTLLSIRAFELTNKIIFRRNKKSKHSTTTVRESINTEASNCCVPNSSHTVLLLFLFNIRSLASSNFITTSSSWRWHADPSWLISCEDNGRKNLKGVHYKNNFCMLVTLCERVLFRLLLFVRKQIFLFLWSIQSTILKWVLSKHLSVFFICECDLSPVYSFYFMFTTKSCLIFLLEVGRGEKYFASSL